MARGFLSGALVGGVVSLGVGAVASVMVPLDPPAPLASPLVSDKAPQGGETPQPVDVMAKTNTVASEDAPVAGQPASQTQAPQPDTLDGLDATTSPSAKAPITSEAIELDAPVDVAQSVAVDLSGEDPVIPNPQALAPMMPEDSDQVAIDTAPAARPLPKPLENPEVSAEAADQIVADALAAARKAQPDAEGQEADASEAGSTEASPAETVVAGNAPEDPAQGEAEQPPAEAPVPETTEALQPSETPQIVQTETETAPAAPPVAEAPDENAPEENSEANTQVAVLAPSARPRIGKPATTLGNRASNVTVNRLGNSSPDATVEQATIITDSPSGIELRPVEKYAQAFSNVEGKPLMGIVLIDDGRDPTAGAPGLAALRSFPYTLSFAVDSSLPDAAERAALYRAEGFEVLAMIDMPQGALASDVETTLGATLSQMPEVVGVLEGAGEGLQASREVADQVTAILAQSGHGLLTQDKGLNTMPKLALKQGVPADPVFRDFDSEGQTATVIRRFLDQAAFKAGQEGAVVMLGRLRPDTISALLLWGLQDRAGKVALAPISAILTREDR